MICLLSWLGGFWDGEGCISIFKRGKYFVPSCKVVNTNKILIDKVCSILDANDIEYYIRYSDRGERKNARPAWEVSIEGRPRVEKFITLLIPYLVSKQQQASIVFDFCQLRKGRDKINEDMDNLVIQVKQLNLRGRVK